MHKSREAPSMERADPASLPYEVKDFGAGSVKDVDMSTNTVTGYYASFGNVDMDKDAFVQGAFEESIQEWGPTGEQRITHLNQHKVDEPLGTPEVLKEDDFGLYFETPIPDTRLGEDVLKLYQAGVYEHSVGFRRVGEEQRDDGVTLITKAQLWEGSNVTWGANSETPFEGFKSAASAASSIADQILRLESVLKEGLTEATAYQIEMGLSQLHTKIERLQEEIDAGDDPSVEEEPGDDEKEPTETIDPLGGGSFFDLDKARKDHAAEVEEQSKSTFFPTQ